ncbi:MAG: tRNA 2-thiouridine(34) synthase MnmA [Patescibacteria group bacterium]|nr:tRNA 2-thiouridine(34) synthase MnmA [Patescibacteria group bacterium]
MKGKKKKKIVVGLSGGIDSLMAMILLKESGWEPIGVSLVFNKDTFKVLSNLCKKLNIPHYIINVKKEFKKEVVGYFIDELKNNRTPNPCMMCNRKVKFKYLFKWAEKHGIYNVATGHYAKVVKNKEDYQLLKAKDKNKDQTYSLAFLKKEGLRKLIFPLGDYFKTEIYKMAKEKGFESMVERKESQDFCFVSDKGIRAWLKREIGEKQGLIKNMKNKVLGKHKGLYFYTIGQRKGINLSDGPYFVVRKDIKENILIVSDDENDLLAKEVIVGSVNRLSNIKDKVKVMVKIRSQHNEVEAELIKINKNKVKIIFNEKQRAVTLGQFAVFYKENVCLGGGRIE